jgi:hypothetical protein
MPCKILKTNIAARTASAARWQRLQNGQGLQLSEVARIEAHGHIVGGNLIISVYRGAVKVKRYLDIADMDGV